MSYYNIQDYRGRFVRLNEESWEHIRESHPELTLEEIRLVLSDPLEVRESPKRCFVELFYQAKSHPEGKQRYSVVVVKVLKEGLFVSTALTTNAMKSGRTLYRKSEGEGR
jgi:hypothetical protein